MMAMMQYLKNKSNADIARIRFILDTVKDVVCLDETDALFEDSSLFLELEPTPIGPNGIQISSSTKDSDNQAFPNIFSTVTSFVKDKSFLNTAAHDINLFEPYNGRSSNIMRPSGPHQGYASIKETHHLENSVTSDTALMMRPSMSLHTPKAIISSPTDLLEPSSQLIAEEEDRDEDYHALSTSIRPYKSSRWLERCHDLSDFKSKHGHCMVPHDFPENPQLAQWTKRQRYQYKLKILGQHSTLTDVRQMKLEEMGFVWEARKLTWYDNLEKLLEFRSFYGHCNVPSNYNLDRSLAIWVRTQRRQMRLFEKGLRSSMRCDRFVALDELGFDWNPRNT